MSSKIQQMRDQQVTRGLRAAAILGCITLLCSIWRTSVVGWHPIVYVHIALYLLILATAILDRHLSYTIRAAIIAGSLFVVGLSALITWGLGGFSIAALFCFCILSTILFGTRSGIICCFLSIAVVATVGVLVFAKVVSYRYDALLHMNAPATWLVGVIVIAMIAGILVVILGTLNRQVEELACDLEARNHELQENNLQLQREMAARARAEEERTRLQTKLQAAEKMEMIGTLAGGVAHDLNNILGSVVGYPDLLLEQLPADSSLKDSLQIIKRSGIKAAAIVNDMLTLARRRIEITDVTNLNSIISEYLRSPEFEMLKRYHPFIDVEVRGDPGLMNIRGVNHQLFKVLMNLVSNAAEAMADGGKILITAENHEVKEPIHGYEEIQKGSYILLRVSDSGTGIPADDLRKIFEPFYSKKKMGRSGTGLGMSVVWGSVKDHSGYIDVCSAEGKGTTFSLYFPSTPESIIQNKPPILRSALQGNGESILIVDDVQEQREMASRIFGAMGYSVQSVRSGEEAIEYLRGSSVDLLILDMHMEPGIDGLDTYRRIIQLRPGQKAIIVTGFAETERIREALREGVGCCVKKPYLSEDIGLAARLQLEKQHLWSNAPWST